MKQRRFSITENEGKTVRAAIAFWLENFDAEDSPYWNWLQQIAKKLFDELGRYRWQK